MIKNSLVTSAKESSVKHELGACLQVGRRDSKRWETDCSLFFPSNNKAMKEGEHTGGSGFRDNWLRSEQWRQEAYARQMKDRTRKTDKEPENKYRRDRRNRLPVLAEVEGDVYKSTQNKITLVMKTNFF